MVIECKNLVKYRKNFRLYIENLVFEEERMYIIEGQNGSGKTTLLNLIAGLTIQDSGEILYDKKIMSGNEKYIKNKIGFITNNVSLPRTYDKKVLSKIFNDQFLNFNIDKYRSYLSIFNIEDDKKIKDMSDGMKKKLLISAILAYSPQILICDEPFNDIDKEAKKNLINEFGAVLKNKGTVILSTHTKDNLKDYEYDIIKIKDGNVCK